MKINIVLYTFTQVVVDICTVVHIILASVFVYCQYDYIHIYSVNSTSIYLIYKINSLLLLLYQSYQFTSEIKIQITNKDEQARIIFSHNAAQTRDTEIKIKFNTRKLEKFKKETLIISKLALIIE